MSEELLPVVTQKLAPSMGLDWRKTCLVHIQLRLLQLAVR